MWSKLNARVLRNIYLGLCFVVLFSAFSALVSVQKTITASIQHDNPSYKTDAYISLGIVYTSMAIGMWLSPGIIAKIGSKCAMIIGSFCNTIYMAAFYTEQSFWIYLCAAICGFGGSIMWTGQANYIVLNSEIGKVHSGIGVFWILYQSSHFLGNLIIYFEFNHENQSVDKAMRTRIISVFVFFAAMATLMMCFIRPPLRHKEQKKIIRYPCTEIVKSSQILFSPRMLLLVVTMACVGLHLSFLSILSSSMGFSKYLSDNSKKLAPLCGLLQGFGEIMGGILSIVVGGKRICNLKPLITWGVICNLACYIIAFLALPNDSPHGFTDNLPLKVLPIVFIIMEPILAGMGDACLHTELYSGIGAMYPNDSSSAFAVFKFIRSIATASSFYYSKCLGLHAQLVIIISTSLVSWILYHFVQWFLIKPKPSQDEEMVEYK
ncbi:UNC93-like protein MFSD11 [Planococcus citri]|uniref:UNC93-like protein MFSD11 n=1 Tax=Planococcus citri TaxID=170843 RepID=UPI0031F8D1FB